MGSKSVFASHLADIASKVSEPVCPLMKGKIQGIICATESISSQNISVARISVSVNQFSSSCMCKVEVMKCPDEITCVDVDISLQLTI